MHRAGLIPYRGDGSSSDQCIYKAQKQPQDEHSESLRLHWSRAGFKHGVVLICKDTSLQSNTTDVNTSELALGMAAGDVGTGFPSSLLNWEHSRMGVHES